MANLFAYREDERSFPALWFVRALGFVLTLIILGLGKSNLVVLPDLSL